MTQIIVTLDKDTNPLKLKNIIDGLKGVFSTTIKEKSEDSIEKEWADSFKRLNEMKIDPSLIDLDDERTKYIMSK